MGKRRKQSSKKIEIPIRTQGFIGENTIQQVVETYLLCPFLFNTLTSEIYRHRISLTYESRLKIITKLYSDYQCLQIKKE